MTEKEDNDPSNSPTGEVREATHTTKFAPKSPRKASTKPRRRQQKKRRQREPDLVELQRREAEEQEQQRSAEAQERRRLQEELLRLQREAAAWERRRREKRGYRREAPGSDMSVSRALEILGITEKASEEEIYAAYNRLIKRVHPDVGGSEFFSKQLNMARDVLREANSSLSRRHLPVPRPAPSWRRPRRFGGKTLALVALLFLIAISAVLCILAVLVL